MLITNIQRFSLDDGPGIRTTVFLAGCNLKCIWCHNPETIVQKQIAFDEKKCVKCGACERVCPNHAQKFRGGEHKFDRNLCQKCFKCVKVCQYAALTVNAKENSVEDIGKQLILDKKYYREKGGVTLSGGEPLLQLEEIKELCIYLKKNGIHIAIETAGNYETDKLKEIAEYIDLVIIDCKAYTEDIHMKCTGVSNKKILHNIEWLSEQNKRFWVRIPVIQGINITVEEMQKIAYFLENKMMEKVEMLPYHKMGIPKYEKYGIEYKLKEQKIPDDEFKKKCLEILKTHGIYAEWRES